MTDAPLAKIAEEVCAALTKLGLDVSDDKALLEAKCQEIRALFEEIGRMPMEKPHLRLRTRERVAYANGACDCLRLLTRRLPAIATSVLKPRSTPQ